MAAAASSRSDRWLSRILEPRVTQLRRDVESVVAGLRGQRRQAWLPRDGSRFAGVGGQLATRELEIVEVVRETPAAISLVLRDPNGQPLPSVRPGQFFTLLVELDGEVLRRAYSVSSDCRDRGRLTLTIKRVADGRVSSYLDQHAAPGLRLRALGPSGEFGFTPEPNRATPRELVLIAGGSGITPMMALIRTLLPSEPNCRIGLIYCNQSAEQIIFAEALTALAAEYGERLHVQHALEQPSPNFTGAVGRGDRPTLTTLLDREPLVTGDERSPGVEYLLCGPTPMMAIARELLLERGVDAARIHTESFLAPRLDAGANAQLRSPQAVTLTLGPREIGVVVRPGQSILEAGLAAGVAMPYSCAMGGCAACKVELERGAVIMREPNCLSASERAAGYILACVANPTEPCRVRVE